MKLNTLQYENEKGIGIITFTKGSKMNAISELLLSDLNKVLDQITVDSEIGVVIITGGKDLFCVGAEISEVAKLKSPMDAHEFLEKVNLVFNKLYNLKKPVIAAVGGLAIGGGCELCLACDIRLAGENASFGQPEIRIGVIPGGGGTQRLPRLIGVGRAKELLYTGEIIDSAEALRIGLVNKVVPVNLLLDEAIKLGRVILEQPRLALLMTKKAVNEGMNMDMASAMAYEARCAEAMFASDDQKEGVNAFVEKRKPIYKGK